MKSTHASVLSLRVRDRKAPKASSLLALTLLPMMAVSALAEESQTQDARYAIGATIGTTGLGLNMSGNTDWSLRSGDQLQWRVMASGLSADFEDDEFDFADIEYNKGDIDMFALQAGVDWFPFASGWSEKVFFSTGLLYSDIEISGSANTDKTFYVGGQQVNKGDITSLQTDIDNQALMPYLSVGWGNKITGESGFDFQAEIGLAASTSDPDVKVTAVDPSNVLSASDLAREKKEVEDEFGGAFGFATIALTYHY